MECGVNSRKMHVNTEEKLYSALGYISGVLWCRGYVSGESTPIKTRRNCEESRRSRSSSAREAQREDRSERAFGAPPRHEIAEEQDGNRQPVVAATGVRGGGKTVVAGSGVRGGGLTVVAGSRGRGGGLTIVAATGVRGGGLIHFTSVRREAVENFANALERAFGKKPRIYQKPLCGKISYGTYVYSKRIASEVNRVMSNINYYLEITPFSIGFVRGFLETKASVVKRRKKIKKGEKIRIKHVTVVKASSSRREKLVTVADALRKLGVNSLITRCSQLWQIEIKGKHNLERLENVTGISLVGRDA